MDRESSRPVPAAIVGMGCLFPRAEDPPRFWANIRDGVDAITEVPPTHWRPEDYFDADPRAADRTYARRGGFLAPVDFPPLDYGISPNTLEATDTTQLLGLVAARQALADAGYGPGGKGFDRSRVSVLLGVTGTLELVIPLAARLGHPLWRRALAEAGVPDEAAEEVVRRIAGGYVGWQEDSFPGLLGNVVAGRIANRLDLGGTNCVVDAACASSLGAVHLAMLELASGRSDMAITGGMDTFNDIFMYMCFSKTPALSPTGDARPFAADGDGTILGEGLGCLVLKRLDDAARDGDRIYAVIKAVGSSSDGKGQAIYAPSPEGQARALRQAYRLAGVSPRSIGLVEAHGTGTRAGDEAEASALAEVYGSEGRAGSWCALGSVKSQIGHTKAAAGAAGLMKAAMALHRKVLPPTIKVDRPIDALMPGRSPFYVNTERRPWLPDGGTPRRAAVSAFGFGGSNYHCVLEEYAPEMAEADWDGDVQLLAFSADSPEALREAIGAWPSGLAWDDVRRAAARTRAGFVAARPCRAVVVADRRKGDLDRLLAAAWAAWEKRPSASSWGSPDGLYHGQGPAEGGLAMLFPGQGAQYPGMFRDLACRFPSMQRALAEADAAFADDRPGEDGAASPRLSDYIYPQPSFDPAGRARDEGALRATEVAQPALGAVALGALGLLDGFGVRPGAVAGHSYGELPSLCAAGRFDAETLHRLSRLRGRSMAEGSGDRGSMLAVLAPREAIDSVLGEDGLMLVVANKNAPRQSVLSGASGEIARARAAFARRAIEAVPLSVAAAFHSPFVAEARRTFSAALQEVDLRAAGIPVFANTTGRAYPDDPRQARDLLAGQLAEPVEFVSVVENMYESGFRTFLEVGPGSKLTGLVGAILKGRPHAAVSLDASSGSRDGMLDLARALAGLAALGHPVDLAAWDGPAASASALDAPEGDRGAKKPSLTIPISGANYVKPKSPAQPTPTADRRAPSAHAIANGVEHAAPAPGGHAPALAGLGNGTPPSNGHHPALRSAATAPPKPPAEPTRPIPAPAPIPAASTNGAIHAPAAVPASAAEFLRASQQGLVALQELGEQTARLHHQFLEGQDRALQVFQTILEQQHGLIQASLGLSIHAPARPPARPALDPPAPSAPVPTPVDVTSPAPMPAARPSIAAPTPAPPVVERAVPAAPVQAPAPVPVPPPLLATARAGVAQAALLAVVAEKTGYPAEMLDPAMEIEADLGIDSIKRVEIFGALAERLPDAPAVRAEHLGILRTLAQVVAFLEGPSTADTPAAPASNGRAEAAPAIAPASEGLAQAALLEVVAEKTGYPAEMLDPAMEIEADLGIDSIKRVEIFGALAERLPDAPAVRAEHLGTLRTLAQVVAFLEGHTTPPLAPALPDEPARVEARPVEPPAPGADRVHRYVVTPVPLDPTADGPALLAPGGEVWVVSDGSDLAACLSRRLEASGVRSRTVSWAELAGLDVPAGLAGLILPAPGPAVDDGFLAEALGLLRAAGPSLRAAGEAGGAAILTVSQLDGAFGLAGRDAAIDPVAGGLAGLAKTAGREWPEVRCRAIDLDPALDGADPDEAARLVLDELLREGPAEVGFGPAGRVTLELREAHAGRAGAAPVGRGDVVVVTGGARGVTAEVAVAMARAWSPTLVLLGRSPAPEDEPAWLAPLADEAEIKRALIARAGGQSTPKAIEADFRRIAANREALSTIGRIEEAGGVASYRRVDVRDEAAVAEALAAVRRDLGPIRALVHGAGVLADALIVDKTPEQFDRVYGTKVGGLRALLGATAGDDLKAIVLFSSSTGRFGRAGQADYAVANEVLNKSAIEEARRRPGCRVVSVNWGPWDGGMVTPALKGLFAAEGVGLIPLEAGAAFLVGELSQADDRAVEIVVLGGEGAPTHPSHAPAPPPLPLVFERELTLASMPVLRSHVIDGRAVLPMALTLEWLAHGALHGHPGLAFHGVDGLRVLRGVFVEEEVPCPVRVHAGKADRRDGLYYVPTELRGTVDGREVVHARAEVALATTLPPPADRPPAATNGEHRPYRRGPAEIYAEVLFHGPALRGIARVEDCSDRRVSAEVASAPPPGEWLARPLRGDWLADPLVLDASFQAMIVWSVERHGAGSLPCHIGRYRQFRRSFPREGVRVVARVTKDGPSMALADIDFLDADGRTVARIEGYECVIDSSLNAAFRRNRTAR